jgi:hypothetical protein
MTTVDITTIQPVERIAHRAGLALVHWSIARAEHRDRVLATRAARALAAQSVTGSAAFAARSVALDTEARERAWAASAGEHFRLR